MTRRLEPLTPELARDRFLAAKIERLEARVTALEAAALMPAPQWRRRVRSRDGGDGPPVLLYGGSSGRVFCSTDYVHDKSGEYLYTNSKADVTDQFDIVAKHRATYLREESPIE